MSRPKKADEVREKFLACIREYSEYWAELPGKTTKERLDGLAFSFLALLDGSAAGFPAIDLILRPHPDDKDYCKSCGNDWYVDGQHINDCALHELWHKKDDTSG